MYFSGDAVIFHMKVSLLFIDILDRGITEWSRILKIKSVAYSSQGSQTGQLGSCNWLAAQRDNVISITLRQVY